MSDVGAPTPDRFHDVPTFPTPLCQVSWLRAPLPYDEGLALQHQLVEARLRGEIPDQLLLLEHPPVLTLGRGGHRENIRVSAATLAQLGVELRQVERGGDVTFHGPGQLVGYPILDLRRRCAPGFAVDLPRYLRDLEEVVLQTLRAFAVAGVRMPRLTGVFVGDDKIAAFGAAVRGHVSFHGFALNVCTDLSHFRLIHPCGIHDRGVTSLAAALGRRLTVAEVVPAVVQAFAGVFACATVDVQPGAIDRRTKNT